MADILLIQPPIRDFYLTRKRTIPYGLASIGAALIQAGFSVTLFDALATNKSRPLDIPEEMAYLERYYGQADSAPFGLFHRFFHFGYSFRHIAQTARDSRAWLIGISALFTAYSNEALDTAEAIKAMSPDCKIVMGGHHPTALPDAVMAHPAVDYVIRGEGEVAMPALAKALSNGDPIDDVPGIVFSDSKERIRISVPAAMKDLDAHPLPAMDLIRKKFYARRKRNTAVITASRGCPLKCTYCAVGKTAHLPFRKRRIESVLRELDENFQRYDVGFIDFEDENISLDRRWFLDLLWEIKRRYGFKKPELRAMNGLYPPSLDETVIQAMKTAGFKSLNLALGTTCPVQQKRFERKDVTTAFDRCLDAAQTHGLDAVGYLIVGGPEQTPEAAVSDLLYLAQRRVLAGVSVYYPAPGSPDYHLCSQLNVLPRHFSLMRSTALPISRLTDRTATVTFLRLGRILNYIKRLIDEKHPIPKPDAKIKNSMDPQDRTDTGRKLLAGFLHDGKIRGISPDGTVFEHCIDLNLTRKFLAGLKGVRLKGVTSSHIHSLPDWI